MSTLQKAIEENTAAIIALTAALSAGAPTKVTITVPAVEPAGAPEAAKPAAAKPEAAKPAAAKPEAAKPAALTYEKDVKPWAIKLAAKDKAAFLAILAKHQATKGSELAPRVLAAALTDIKAALDV